MARYSLIVKDSTYMELLKLAAKQTPPKTFGKYVNEILNKHVEDTKGGQPTQSVCIICGKRATLQVFGKGQQKFFVCTNHKKLAEKTGNYKPFRIRKDGCLQP